MVLPGRLMRLIISPGLGVTPPPLLILNVSAVSALALREVAPDRSKIVWPVVPV